MTEGGIQNVPMISLEQEENNDEEDYPVYTLEQVKSFWHPYKLTDPESLKRLEQMNYYRTHMNDPIEPESKFKAPEDQMIYSINHSINKLTANIDKIRKTADKMIHELYFGTERFINEFSKIIVESAILQTPLAVVYTRFIQEIYLGLPTPDQRKLLLEKLNDVVFDHPEKSSAKAFFLGCLVSADLADKPKVFEIVNLLIKEGTTESYEVLFNLLIYSGQKLEKTFSAFDEVISAITEAACNTNIKQRVRFMLMDLLEEREANWKIGKLIPNLVHVEDSKEDEQELSGIDGSILRTYVLEHNLPSKFISENQIYSLLFSLTIASMKDYEIGICALKELVDRKEKLFMDKCIVNLQKVKINADTEDILVDYPYAVRTVGAIFAQLLVLGFDPKLFGSEVFPYDVIVFIGILEELLGIERTDIIQKNPYLAELKFLPALHSHSQVVAELLDFDLTDIYPVYEAMRTIFQMINSDEDPESVKNYLSNDLDKNVFKSTNLIEFVTEFFVIHKPKRYQCLLEYIAKKPLESLKHVETIGELYQWKPEQIAANIRRLADLIKAPIDDFRNKKIRPFHDIVVKYL